VEVFTRALNAAWEESTMDAPHAEGHVCDDDSCTVSTTHP
jgi:hypothetical protein